MLSKVIASTGQTFAQAPHPIQPAEQFIFTALPKSWLLHFTNTSLLAGFSTIKAFGHTSLHFPQFTHFSSSTTATPFSILIASNLHTDTHVPNPKHPALQAFDPPIKAAAALQSFKP